MASLYALDLEKQFLSGLIRHPEIIADCPFITEQDFGPTNLKVFQAFKACVASGVEFSSFLLVDRLNSLGVKIGDAIEPGLYVKSLEGMMVSDKAAIGIAKQLKNTTIRRKLNETGRRIVAATDKDEQKKAADLLAEVTEMFNAQTNILSGSDDEEPEDLFGTVGKFLEEETTFDSRSILTPFPTYSDMFGSLDAGNLYVIGSRMGVGKSTFWLSMAQQLAVEDEKDELRILVLDTELTKEENQSRVLSAVSGVKEYNIRHKKYRKYPEMRKKVEDAAAFIAPLAGRLAHRYVGGKDLAHMLSIARRWAAKTLKDGKRGLIVLDYLKLNSASDFKTKALFLTVGEKADAFKNLSKELNVPVLTFVQTNRENEDSKGGSKIRNSSAIAGGDMLAQFGANVYLLERFSAEERKQLCPDDSGKFTHGLFPIKTRQLGPDTLGMNRLVKYTELAANNRTVVRWVDNYLLFNFDSFNVNECVTPTLYDLIQRNTTRGINVQAAPLSPKNVVPLRPPVVVVNDAVGHPDDDDGGPPESDRQML